MVSIINMSSRAPSHTIPPLKHPVNLRAMIVAPPTPPTPSSQYTTPFHSLPMFREIGAKNKNKVLIFGQSHLISEWSWKGIENDKELWKQFKIFVETRRADENTDFIDEMKGINYDNEDVQSIMETYINEGSTKQVNLSGPQRQRVIDAYDSLDPNNAQTIRVNSQYQNSQRHTNQAHSKNHTTMHNTK